VVATLEKTPARARWSVIFVILAVFQQRHRRAPKPSYFGGQPIEPQTVALVGDSPGGDVDCRQRAQSGARRRAETGGGSDIWPLHRVHARKDLPVIIPGNVITPAADIWLMTGIMPLRSAPRCNGLSASVAVRAESEAGFDGRPLARNRRTERVEG